VTTLREILTVRDVALELRCSVTHVHNVINGKVKNVARLPAIRMGRKRLVLRDTLEEWKRSNEQSDDDDMIAPSKINAVRRMEEDLYA
jgi:excisionase family DNA binding protein